MQRLLNYLNSLPTTDLLLVSCLPLLFAVTVHEVAHGWIAKRLGDPTADRLGRLTLNPLKHIDPVGTVLLPAVLILLKAGFIFGWAKPVPVTWENLHSPKRDMVLVALAGPVANFLMALLWGVVAKIGFSIDESFPWAALPMQLMGMMGIFINVVLMVFNLFPLPPLDGGRVAVGLLPGRWGWGLSRVEPYGFFILIGLMITGALWVVLGPLFTWIIQFVVYLTGLSI